MFAPGRTVTKKYSVSYTKAGEGTKSSTFDQLGRALEYYQEKKQARRCNVQLQLISTVTTVEVLDAQELLA